MEPPPLPESLRWHREPYQVLDDPAIHRALTLDPAGYASFLDARLRAIAAGDMVVEQPPKQIFDDPGGGDFRVMPCVTKGPEGTFKTVKVVGTNVCGQVVPDQVTVGKAVVLHPVENYVTHLADGCLLSSARTGACAAIGASRITASVGRVQLIGAGRVAYYTARYLAALNPEAKFSIFDSLSQRADRLARDLEWEGIPASRSDAVSDASDLIVLATTSASPILSRRQAGEAAVVSVGADTPWQRELADDWGDEAAVLSDTMDSLRVGDLRAWGDRGLPRPAIRLLTGRPEPGERFRVFVSTGCALFDNLTLEYLVRNGTSGTSEIHAGASAQFA